MKNGVIFVLLSTIGLSLKGIWARLAYAEGMDVGGVVFYRAAMATPLLLLGGLVILRSTGDTRQVSFRDLLPAIALGALFSVGMTADFQAIAHLGASVSRVILFGFPLLVLAIDSFVQRRLPSAHQLTGFLFAWLGLTLVASGGFNHGGSLAPHGNLTALSWGVLSLILYAIFVWSSGRVSRHIGSVRFTMASQLTTALTIISFLLIRGSGTPPQAPVLGLFWVGVMVVVSTVIPYFLMTEAITRLGASEASMLSMGGPVLTVMAGWIVLDEHMSALQILGTVAVIGGVGLTQRRAAPSRTERVAASPAE